uniref:Uncharacterized protein n=1 Tax=mine drainage metagenome TaxID=410659 RepID=E6PHU1_9ZZZZ
MPQNSAKYGVWSNFCLKYAALILKLHFADGREFSYSLIDRPKDFIIALSANSLIVNPSLVKPRLERVNEGALLESLDKDLFAVPPAFRWDVVFCENCLLEAEVTVLVVPLFSKRKPPGIYLICWQATFDGNAMTH